MSEQFAQCPICKQPHKTYRDAKNISYYTRHQQAGKFSWCKMSSKKVVKK